MTSGAAENVSRLLKQAIVTLCREKVTFRNRLEIDGIVCLAVDGADQHVVKIHELFNNKTSPAVVLKEEPRLPTPDLTRVVSPVLSNGNISDVSKHPDTNSSIDLSEPSMSPRGKSSSQLFENLPFRCSPSIKQELTDEHVVTEASPSSQVATASPYVTFDKQRFPGIEKLTLSNAKDIPCKRCGKTMENVQQYENHNMVSHGHFTCMICLSTFTSRNNMKRHIRLHTGVKPYVCHKCPESFSRNDDFKRHLLRHTFQKPFRCATCQSGFSDRGSVRAHMMKEHTCGVFHGCPQCGECFTDGKQLMEHKKTHTEFLDYRCSLCSFTGSNALMYNKHMLTHGPHKQYTCQHCEISYPDPFTYTNHLKKHKTDELVQTYRCCFCDLTLPTFEQFQRHEHSHVHSKQHTCSVCQKHFRYPSNLREHMLTHIPKSDLLDAAKNHMPGAKNYTTDANEVEDTVTLSTDADTNQSNIKYESDAEELNDVSDDLEENNNDIPKAEEQYSMGMSDYWCTECQQGFGTEHDLQDHITSQHEQSGTEFIEPVSPKQEISGGPDTENNCATQLRSPYEACTQIDAIVAKTKQRLLSQTYDDGTKVNKRKSSAVGRKFMMPKRSRVYDEDTIVDEIEETKTTNELQNIPVPAMAEMKSAIKDEVIYKQLDAIYGTPGKASILERANDVENVAGNHREPAIVLVMPVGLVDTIPNNFDQNFKSESLAITASLRKQIESRRDGSSGEPPADETGARVAQSNRKKRGTKTIAATLERNGIARMNDVTGSDDTTDSLDLSQYSKSSVLGMDTEFSASPNSISPTTINLKVRNPGFEKVITPDILFETKAPFTCEICKETISDFKTFDQHGVKIHRRFICSYCGKAFTSRPNRERHVRYHTGEKPYKCDLCAVSFFRGDDLKYHRTTKHADVKPFTCGACKASFSYPKDLEKHLRVHPDHKLI